MTQVAVGVIVNKGCILTCQRKRDAKYPLKWEFPGGKLEHGESPEAALVRELREELAIEAVVESELYRQDWTYPQSATDPVDDGSFRVFYFLIRKFSGTPVNHAFEQIRWVTADKLAAMDILQGNRAAVAIILENADYVFQHQRAQSNLEK